MALNFKWTDIQANSETHQPLIIHWGGPDELCCGKPFGETDMYSNGGLFGAVLAGDCRLEHHHLMCGPCLCKYIEQHHPSRIYGTATSGSFINSCHMTIPKKIQENMVKNLHPGNHTFDFTATTGKEPEKPEPLELKMTAEAIDACKRLHDTFNEVCKKLKDKLDDLSPEDKARFREYMRGINEHNKAKANDYINHADAPKSTEPPPKDDDSWWGEMRDETWD